MIGTSASRCDDVQPIEKPRRERSRKHLAFVGAQPCCIPGCRRDPVQVHHLTHATPGLKARGLKTSDAFTVPLCVHHHTGDDGVRRVGREGDWWAAKELDGVAFANVLWRANHGLAA